MSYKKLIITMIILALFIAGCARKLAPSIDPLPSEASTTQPADPTGTPVPVLTATPTATTISPTATSQPPDPTSTPTATTAPSTATSQPPDPTTTPTQQPGNLGVLWNLADVRYGVYSDKLRVVVEMVENRNTMPYYEIKEVENATVPFPTGHDLAWGVSRIDLVISDLYAYNSPILGQLPFVPPENPAVTRIGSYPTFDDARLGFSIGLKAPLQFKLYELTNPVRIVIDVLYPTPDVLPTPTSTAVEWSPFTNPIFAVSLNYPAHWVVDPGYSTPEQGDIRFTGDDGFFMINAADAESIDVYVASEANHILKPYGSAPILEYLTLQGQDARFIWPSADQSMPEQAALVVQYPQPVSIGSYNNTLFVLYAGIDYIRAIADTVTFESVQ